MTDHLNVDIVCSEGDSKLEKVFIFCCESFDANSSYSRYG
jgi:hypothetical protein